MRDILGRREAAFGALGRRRYETLAEQALVDLLEDPARSGVAIVAGRIHYHLRYSGRRVPRSPGQVGRPRYLIIARIIDKALVVSVLARDRMDDELRARIREGEADLEG